MTERGKRAADARDKRNEPHDIDELSPGNRVRAKKDTKRWCRGKEGREHEAGEWVWRTFFSGYKSGELSCKACGKRLEHKFIRPGKHERR